MLVWTECSQPSDIWVYFVFFREDLERTLTLYIRFLNKSAYCRWKSTFINSVKVQEQSVEILFYEESSI